MRREKPRRRPFSIPHGRLILEPLETRDVPSFVTATSFVVGKNVDGLVPQGSDPSAVAVGDFNGDGKMDLVTANGVGPGVTLLLGKGNGRFQPRVNLLVGPDPADILAEDVNGDNRLDIVTANRGNNTITVLRGNGDGTFKAAKTYGVGVEPVEIAAADFNNDGRTDLAVVNGGNLSTPSNTVSILFGAAVGGFTPGGTATVGNNPTSVAVGDFNGDGKPDLASVSGGFGHLDINLNLGNGTFGAKVNYETGFVATGVQVADLNGDQKDDVAVGCAFPSQDGISILLGNGDGTLQTFTKYDAGGQDPRRLAIADLNGDGIKDIVTANEQFANNSVSVLIGTGNGVFGPARVYTAGQGPVDVAVADFNSDGILDVVTADHDGDVGTVSLLRGNGNGTLVAAPDIIATVNGPMVSADINNDGVQDLAIVSGSGVGVLLGNGNGTFGAQVQSPAISAANALAIAKINADLIPDLVVSTSSGVSVLIGNGNGTFGSPVSFAAGSNPDWVVVDDFNGDGKADLAVANTTASNTPVPGVSVLLGNSDGTFGAAVSVQAGGAVAQVSTTDFNNDGKRDLVVVHYDDHSVSCLMGKGDGTFNTAKTYSVEISPGSVGVGDFNRDGKKDFAVSTFFGKGLELFQNTTGAAFARGPEYNTDSRPRGIAVGDLTGDGKLDLAVVNSFSENVYLFPGRGDGTFGAPKVYVVGHAPEWIAAADFNNDGQLDLAVANATSDTITLLHTPSPAATFRVHIVPTTTAAGAAFKVTVSALDADGRLATGFTGKITLTSSDAKAVLPLPYTFTAADFGMKSFTVTLKTAGTQNILVNGGALGGTDSVDVVAAAASSFSLTAPSSTATGAAFDLTVTARDRFGNVATGYHGTIKFTSSDTSLGVLLPPNYTFDAVDEGTHTFSVTLVKAGKQTVNIKDVAKPTILYRTASVTVTA